MMTLGDPCGARVGAGHAGVDSSTVLPITPGNGVPGSYSRGVIASPFGQYLDGQMLELGRWTA
jgi:hypothetical protein